MKLRRLAAWSCAIFLLGTGAPLGLGQTPSNPQPVKTRDDTAKAWRAEVVRLRTEVEMLRFDYELARDGLLEDLKLGKASWLAVLKMDVPSPIMSWFEEELMKISGGDPPKKSEEDRKRVADLTKLMELAGKKQEAETAAFLAERKKTLATVHGAWIGKQMELEDAERNYRDLSR